MLDIVTICGIIIGVILMIISKKRGNSKLLNMLGSFIIIISLAISAPSFIGGFMEGLNS